MEAEFCLACLMGGCGETCRLAGTQFAVKLGQQTNRVSERMHSEGEKAGSAF